MIKFNKFIFNHCLTFVIFFIRLELSSYKPNTPQDGDGKPRVSEIINEMAGLPGKGSLAFFLRGTCSLKGITALSRAVLRRETSEDFRAACHGLIPHRLDGAIADRSKNQPGPYVSPETVLGNQRMW